MKPEDRILIGVVGKPHGVRGGFYLEGCVDAPALRPGLEVWIADSRHTVVSRGGTDDRPIVSLDEIGDRDQVAGLRGSAIRAARQDLTPLAEGEWFADDLIGLPVAGRGGEALGEVTRLVKLPSVDVLEVRPAEGADLMIPMVRDAIVSIDLEAGITVDGSFLDLG